MPIMEPNSAQICSRPVLTTLYTVKLSKKMRITLHCVALVVLLFVSVSHSASQDTNVRTPVGTVTGRVFNATTLSPIPGATVRIVGTPRGSFTKPDGRFSISNVLAGVVSIRVTAVGFDSTIRTDVAVSSGKPVVVDITLNEVAIQGQSVIVTAESFRRDPQTITSTQLLTSEEIRRAPGVQEDVVRAIALLPGVAVTAAGRNDLAVRGGAPFENLFIVDNIEVPNINHFGSQGSTGGPLSIINIDFVRDVSLSTGGFGPRFGDRLSSVTSINLRDGNNQEFGGEINLSATGFGLIAEGPTNSKGSYMVSVRRSYLDLIFSLAGFSFIPEYYDMTAKVSQDIDDRNTLSFLAIGAIGTVRFDNDSADGRFSNSRVTAPSQNQYFTGLTWRHLFDRGFITTTLGRTFTAYSTTQQDSNGTIVFRNRSDEGDNTLRSDLTMVLSPALELNAGVNARYASRLSYDIVLPGFARRNQNGIPVPLSVDTVFGAFRSGLYAQAVWKPNNIFKLAGGFRTDWYAFLDNAVVISPRLSVSAQIAPSMTTSISAGRYYQPPQFIWLVGDAANRTGLKPLSTDQVVASWDWLAREDLKVQVEVYYKQYTNYPIRLFRPQAVLAPSGFDDITNDIPFGLEPLSMNGTGTAYGIELFIQKRLSEDIPIFGLASISINRTRFTALDGVERPGSFDTPIIGSIALGWRPSSDWELSSKIRLSEGLPSTPFISTDAQAQASGFPIGSIDFSQFNLGDRLQFFYALDVRVDKRWFFSGWQLITYIDVQNVTGRRNVSGIRWDPRTQSTELQQSIGLLPSIGVNIEF